MIYTGVGSRSTPSDVLDLMEKIGKRMAALGFTLRSGGAEGADKAFEFGCRKAHGQMEIYLPWKKFNGSSSPLYGVSEEAMDIAGKFHPAWYRCSSAAKALHGRNIYQVLGRDLNKPSTLLICWTPNGSGSGGTGQAIRMALAYGVPVFDLGKENGLNELGEFMNNREK